MWDLIRARNYHVLSMFTSLMAAVGPWIFYAFFYACLIPFARFIRSQINPHGPGSIFLQWITQPACRRHRLWGGTPPVAEHPAEHRCFSMAEPAITLADGPPDPFVPYLQPSGQAVLSSLDINESYSRRGAMVVKFVGTVRAVFLPVAQVVYMNTVAVVTPVNE